MSEVLGAKPPLRPLTERRRRKLVDRVLADIRSRVEFAWSNQRDIMLREGIHPDTVRSIINQAASELPDFFTKLNAGENR